MGRKSDSKLEHRRAGRAGSGPQRGPEGEACKWMEEQVANRVTDAGFV